MRNFISTFFTFCISLNLSFAQVEYTYEYLFVRVEADGAEGKLDINGSIFRVRLNDPKSFIEPLNFAGKLGYRAFNLTQTDLGITKIIIFERAIRVDNQVVEARVLTKVAEVKAELEERIIKVSEDKAKAATDQLRVQLIDAIKDASLFEEKYKNSVIDAALSKFREELNKAIQDLKNN